MSESYFNEIAAAAAQAMRHMARDGVAPTPATYRAYFALAQRDQKHRHVRSEEVRTRATSGAQVDDGPQPVREVEQVTSNTIAARCAQERALLAARWARQAAPVEAFSATSAHASCLRHERLERIARAGDLPAAVCRIDLVGFRAVIDAYGEEFAHAALRHFLRCAKTGLDPDHEVVRTGVGEFTLLLHGVTEHGGTFIVRALQRRFGRPLRTPRQNAVSLSFTFGIVDLRPGESMAQAAARAGHAQANRG